MAIISGYDSSTRERVLTQDPTEQKAFGKEVYSTPSGQRFVDQFAPTSENLDVVLAATQTIYPGAKHITVSMYVAGMEAAMNRAPSLERWKPGLLKRKPASPVVSVAPVEPAQTDRNGKKLGASQRAWQEHAEWARTATSEQIRKRKAVDSSFRAFVQNSLRLEMSDEPVDAAIQTAVTPERNATGPDMRSELGQFSAAYKKASTTQLRPIGGFHKLSFPDAHGNVIERLYSPSEWEVLITKAASIGLL